MHKNLIIDLNNPLTEFDKEIWYEELERLCPNYYQLLPKERIPIRAKVDEAVGFHLEY